MLFGLIKFQKIQIKFIFIITYSIFKCSAKCGRGIQTRQVECYSLKTNMLSSELSCDYLTKPNSTQTCAGECEETQPLSFSNKPEWKIVSKEKVNRFCRSKQSKRRRLSNLSYFLMQSAL
jgi:hypothetical protein